MKKYKFRVIIDNGGNYNYQDQVKYLKYQLEGRPGSTNEEDFDLKPVKNYRITKILHDEEETRILLECELNNAEEIEAYIGGFLDIRYNNF